MPTIGAPKAGRKERTRTGNREQAIEALSLASRHLHHRLSAFGAGTTEIETLTWARMLNAALGAYGAARCEIARLRRINAALEDEIEPVRIVA